MKKILCVFICLLIFASCSRRNSFVSEVSASEASVPEVFVPNALDHNFLFCRDCTLICISVLMTFIIPHPYFLRYPALIGIGHVLFITCLSLLFSRLIFYTP